MTQFNFQANREVVAKQYNLGKGEYFKVKEGDNKIRLVSACLPHPSEYNGRPQFKWLCQVLDLTDNKVKPYFMPDRIYQNIMSLQMDEDYAFDEIPMPYNINIKAENAGKMEVKYAVIPSPKRIELNQEQLNAITAAPTVDELQKKIRESEKNQPQEVQAKPLTQEEEEMVENIPF
jgi:hypothetical protein